MVELVDTLALGASAARRASSSLAPGTRIERLMNMGWREEASERSRKIQKSISKNENDRFKSKVVQVLKELGIVVPPETSIKQGE